jgi:hypothetical protein
LGLVVVRSRLIFTKIGIDRNFYVQLKMSWRSLRGDRRQSIADLSASIERTANTMSTFIQNVGINHGRFDIFMAQEFLNGADIVVVL